MQGALDKDEARRKREDNTLSLSKTKREENLQKRRKDTEGKSFGIEAGSSSSPVVVVGPQTHAELRAQVKNLPQLVNDLKVRSQSACNALTL